MGNQKTMAFSLLYKIIIFSLALSLVYTGTLIELPQADNANNGEDNLECLLKVLKDFDERRNDAPLPEIAHLYDHIQPGVDRNIDINTLLLQYFNLKDINDKETNYQFKPRQMINECNLNLLPALARCKAAYGKSLTCEQVEYGSDALNKAPFVTPKCPPGIRDMVVVSVSESATTLTQLFQMLLLVKTLTTRDHGLRSTTASRDQLSDLRSRD